MQAGSKASLPPYNPDAVADGLSATNGSSATGPRVKQVVGRDDRREVTGSTCTTYPWRTVSRRAAGWCAHTLRNLGDVT